MPGPPASAEDAERDRQNETDGGADHPGRNARLPTPGTPLVEVGQPRLRCAAVGWRRRRSRRNDDERDRRSGDVDALGGIVQVQRNRVYARNEHSCERHVSRRGAEILFIELTRGWDARGRRRPSSPPASGNREGVRAGALAPRVPSRCGERRFVAMGRFPICLRRLPV